MVYRQNKHFGDTSYIRCRNESRSSFVSFIIFFTSKICTLNINVHDTWQTHSQISALSQAIICMRSDIAQ